MLLDACTKPSPAPAPAPEQYDRYIFFSHGVETKASLIEKAADLNGKAFGVVGFKYSFYDENGQEQSWDEYKKNNPTPNVFIGDDGKPTNVETVNVVGAQGTNAPPGTPYYEPLQGWSNSKKYAFFAFYPMPNENVTLVNLDGTPYAGGVPAIKYTMTAPTASTDEGPADGAPFKASMVDLMTAAPYMDLYWKSSTDNSFVKDEDENNNTSGALGEVNFAFSHKLSCLGLNIKNQSSGSIQIDEVTLIVSNLKYQQLIIPLDPSAEVTVVNPTGNLSGSIEFNLDPKLNLQEDQNSLLISAGASKELDDKLIFIPQGKPATENSQGEGQDKVTITLTVKYTRYADGYAKHEDSYSKYNLLASLFEGQKNLINLSFTESTVNVTINRNPWAVKYTVDNSFN